MQFSCRLGSLCGVLSAIQIRIKIAGTVKVKIRLVKVKVITWF
jgi:hypothetical protein